MENFENDKESNILNKENKLLNPDNEIRNIMTQEMSEYFDKGRVWEAIIIAGEIASSGMDTKKLLKQDQIEKAQNELKQLRAKIKAEDNPNEYIDLARCIYRFQNIGIDFPELNDDEREKLKNLPEYMRTNQNYPKEHLAYIPQIASAIGQKMETLKKPADANIIREKIEQDIISKKERESQFHSMIIGGGLLAQFDSNEAKKLLESKVWKEDKKWQDVLNYLEKIKAEKNGWFLARLLPQVQSLIRLKRENQ
jgi:hypothetical protein